MDPKNKENLSKLLKDVNDLLGKNKIVEDLVDKQEMPKQKLIKNLVQKQNLSSLGKLLNSLHSADVAFILESLPLDDRLIVWDLVRADRDGEILLEVSDSVRQTLIADMDSTELLAAAEQLDTDEIADIAADLPEDVLQDLLQSLDSNNRERLESALSYPEDQVGALMDFDIVTIRDDISLEVALRYLRKIKKLPELTDKLFVVNRSQKILGVLSLKKIVVNEPELMVKDVMAQDAVLFKDTDDAAEAAKAFERYDLVTAPVVNDQNKLVGRITVDAVMDYIREETDNNALSMVGLREGEDIFSSIWKSVRNRWAWLAINLITALIASRVIGVFEGSIEKVVALAELMTIVE
jgi:magnesium transporter